MGELLASGLIFEEMTHPCSSHPIGLNAASGAYLLAREPGKCQLPVGQSNVYLKLRSAITKGESKRMDTGHK